MVETVLLNQQLQITMKQYKCQVHQENIQLHLIQMEEQHLIVKHQHINLQVGIQMQQMEQRKNIKQCQHIMKHYMHIGTIQNQV